MTFSVADVCEVGLAREAGLPRTALTALAMPRTTLHLNRIRSTSQTRTDLRDGLEGELYRLVSSIDDPALRRRVIGLRRDIHNDRARVVHHAVAREVDALLARPTAEALTSWITAGLERDAATSYAAADFAEESTAVADRVRDALLDPALFGTLALASHEFATALARRPLHANPRSRGTRSAIAYLTRIVAKCSPFGAFTTVRPVGTDIADSASRDAVETVTSSRAIAVALLFTSALDASADAIPLDALRASSGRAVTTRRIVLGRTLTRIDEVVAGLDGLPGRPVTDRAELRQSHTDSDIDLQIESGLLIPPVEWDLGCSHQFAASANALERTAPGSAGAIAARALAQCEADLASGCDRLATLATARAAAAAIPRPRVDGLFPDPAVLAPFHSIVSNPTTAAALPHDAADTARRVARTLIASTIVDPRYDSLRSFFLRTHGRSSSIPLNEFVLEVLTDLDTTPRSRPAAGTVLPYGTVAPPTYSIVVRAEGDTRVVEQALCCAPGQLTRWAIAPHIAGAMGGVGTWLSARASGVEPVLYAAHADVVDMQHVPPTPFVTVSLPGDLEDTGKRSTLADYSITFDEASGTLLVTSAAGDPTTFVDVGSVPRHLQSGPATVLAVLSEPWILTRYPGNDRRVHDDGRFGFTPREVVDGVVWARARWSFRPADIPQPESYSSDIDFLLAVAQWREARALPDEVFVTRVFRSPYGTRTTKPQWASFDHPFSLTAALAALPGDCAAVDVVEALPSVTGSPGPESAVEYLTLVSAGWTRS